MTDQLKEGQNIVLEGRLRMNSVTREDGTKEKQAELTASRIHHITPVEKNPSDVNDLNSSHNKHEQSSKENSENTNWNSAPLVPEVDEIPF